MQIKYITVNFGADPEFFFTQNGAVIGAEKVLPKEGVRHYNIYEQAFSGNPMVVIDGVQAEFNPTASYCRESFSSNLRQCFVELSRAIHGKEIDLDFAAGVAVTKKELASLDAANQQFGCQPSFNAHREAIIQVKDASKYTYRSAGGHIHLGTYDKGSLILKSDPELVVKILDVLLGNTCVLLDRDEGNIERRKNYGRAGEYRTPEHGLEYRTLSNFWLRSYQLTSFVLGVARFAVQVASDKKATKKLLSLVDMAAIEEAINTNNFELAYQNFNAIKEFVATLTSVVREGVLPFEGTRVQAFEKLVAKGIPHYFKQSPMEHWLNFSSSNGWERFADGLVAPPVPKTLKRFATFI